MGTKFTNLMRGIEEEAQAEGPAAVAELEKLRAYFRLGRQLAEARQRQNLTQGEVARLAHIDQPQVSDIERGAANPTFNTLRAVAGALGFEVTLRPAAMKSAPAPIRPRRRTRRLVEA